MNSLLGLSADSVSMLEVITVHGSVLPSERGEEPIHASEEEETAGHLPQVVNTAN